MRKIRIIALSAASAGLLLLAVPDAAMAQAAEAATGLATAAAPTGGANTWNAIVDWSIANLVLPLVAAAIPAVVGAIFAPRVGLLWTWLAKRSIELDEARQKQFEDAATRALSWAFTTLFSSIREQGPSGWTSSAVHEEAKARAKEYMVERFPNAVRAQVGSTSLVALSELADPVLQRVLPGVVAEVAASPATPPAPSPTAVPVVEVGQRQ